MQIIEHSPGDIKVLKQKIQLESNAKQRDRYRVVAMAIEGMQTKQIMKKLDRSKNFVQRWNYFYRDGGIEAITAKRQTGRPTKLDSNEESVFKKRITAGPVESDEVCTFVGRDAKSILEKEFGVKYSLPGAYALIHRLGLSCLMPRPKHRKNDPEKMQQWLEDAPFLSKKSEKVTPAKKSKYGSRTKSE